MLVIRTFVMQQRRVCPGTRLHGRGFTLTELLVVLSIMAILVALAAPSFAVALASQRVRAAGTDLMGTLMFARSEAIKRNTRMQIAPQTAGDWTRGWRVTTVATDEQVDKAEPLGSRVAVAVAPAEIVYDRSGRLAVAGVAQVEFRDRDEHPGVLPRCVSVDPSGLPRLQVGSCS